MLSGPDKLGFESSEGRDYHDVHHQRALEEGGFTAAEARAMTYSDEPQDDREFLPGETTEQYQNRMAIRPLSAAQRTINEAGASAVRQALEIALAQRPTTNPVPMTESDALHLRARQRARSERRQRRH